MTPRKAPAPNNIVALSEYTTRQVIIDGALRCLQKYQIEKTSLSSIASEARVTRATVYSYFSTKEEVLHAALMQIVEQFCVKLLAHIESYRSANERLLESMVYICVEIPKDPYLKFMTDPAMAEQVNAMTLTSRDGEWLRLELLKKILGKHTLSPARLEELCEIVTRMAVSVLVMAPGKKKNRKELHAFFKRFISL